MNVMMIAKAANIALTETLYKGFLGMFLESTGVSSAVLFYTLIIGSFVVCAAIAYFIGSVNFGIVVSGKFYKDDVRNYGSGNAGATNMLRTYGKRAAAITLIGDLLKGFISVMIARLVFGVICGYVAGLVCILGHVFPIYYKFKGGKGVATTAGVVLALDWRIFLVLIAIFAIIVLGTKFVSLGSIIVAMLLPILVNRMGGALTPPICVLISFIMAAVVVILHRANIKRLLEGKESKISFKSKKNKENNADGADAPSDSDGNING